RAELTAEAPPPKSQTESRFTLHSSRRKQRREDPRPPEASRRPRQREQDQGTGWRRQGRNDRPRVEAEPVRRVRRRDRAPPHRERREPEGAPRRSGGGDVRPEGDGVDAPPGAGHRRGPRD